MAFSESTVDKLLDIAGRVDDNKYLSAIKNAFTSFLPFVVIGSFGNLFTTVICSTDYGLAHFIPALAGLSGAFSGVNYATISMISVYIAFFIGMNLADRNKTPKVVTGALCVASFIAVCPSVVEVTIDEISGTGAGLSNYVTGAQGLFISMFVSIVAAELLSIINKIDAIKIKMPKEVPSGIATSFNVLVPAALVLFIVAILGGIFQQLSGSYLNEVIYDVIQAPLQVIFQTPGGIIILIIIMQLFWFLGIHGGLVLFPIRQPLVIAALATNIALADQGLAPTEAITDTFWLSFTVFGGSGIAFALLLDVLLFGKKPADREVCKLSLIPGIFGISEPVMFGIPIVLNPIYFIPFVLGSAVSTGIALGAMSLGVIAPSIVSVPPGIPPIITAFLGFGWQGVVVQLIGLAVCMALYYPFLKLSDRAYERELAQNTVEGSEA